MLGAPQGYDSGMVLQTMQQPVQQPDELNLLTPEIEQGLRAASIVATPINGLIWGAIIGAIAAPSGKRWDVAKEAGLWSAGINFAVTLPCLSESMTGVCFGLGLIPVSLISGIYLGMQARK